MNLQRFYSTLVLCSVWLFGLRAQQPRLIIPIILDQGAELLIKKVLPDCSKGLKKLCTQGIYYTNAYFPHGCPNTASGHAGLSTGAYPDIHGIIDNKFMCDNGTIIASDEDPCEASGTFRADGSISGKGKSCTNLCADTLADQFMIASEPPLPHHCATFSLKSRSAIMLAGRQGKPFWFSEKHGHFTTSNAYFKTFPEWLKNFNAANALNPESNYHWKQFFPSSHPAYQKRALHDYSHSSIPSIINTKIFPHFPDEEPYELFAKSPWGCTTTLDLAYEYIKRHVDPEKPDRHLIWISLSGIDKAGHMFGPDSMEVHDLVYHLDAQLGNFIEKVYEIIPQEEVLFVLTADHGIFEIPEVMQARGFTMPTRILSTQVIKSMNNLVKRAHNISDLVVHFDAPHFCFDKEKFCKLSAEKRTAIEQLLIHFLKRVPGIRNAWTPEQLLAMNPASNTFEYRFKRQLFPGRGGDIIVHVNPYIMLTPYPKGTSHATPYWYDVHVPLALYQAGRWEPKRITEPVIMLRLAATLAQLMGIQAPSAAEQDPLPGAI